MIRSHSIKAKLVVIILGVIVCLVALLGRDLVYERQITDTFIEPPNALDNDCLSCK